jgi:hypothetical protein
VYQDNEINQNNTWDCEACMCLCDLGSNDHREWLASKTLWMLSLVAAPQVAGSGRPQLSAQVRCSLLAAVLECQDIIHSIVTMVASCQFTAKRNVSTRDKQTASDELRFQFASVRWGQAHPCVRDQRLEQPWSEQFFPYHTGMVGHDQSQSIRSTLTGLTYVFLSGM